MAPFFRTRCITRSSKTSSSTSRRVGASNYKCRTTYPHTGVHVSARCVGAAWRKHLYTVASPAMGHWGTCPLDYQQFHFSSLWSKSDSQLAKYCVVCKISWCRCQQLTALSVTKLLVIEQLLHRPWSSLWVPHDLIFKFAPTRNKSWRRHCLYPSTPRCSLCAPTPVWEI